MPCGHTGTCLGHSEGGGHPKWRIRCGSALKSCDLGRSRRYGPFFVLAWLDPKSAQVTTKGPNRAVQAYKWALQWLNALARASFPCPPALNRRGTCGLPWFQPFLVRNGLSQPCGPWWARWRPQRDPNGRKTDHPGQGWSNGQVGGRRIAVEVKQVNVA